MPSDPVPAWVGRDQNQFGIALLDCRSVAHGTTAWTTNKEIVETFGRLRKSTGAEHVNRRPDDSIEVACALRFPYSGAHGEGPVFKALAMEDKWDMYLYGDCLYIARSWSGNLCFVAPCEFKAGVVEIRRIIARSETVFGDTVYAGRVVDYLINSHMSNRVVPHPFPARMRDAPPGDLAAHSFEMFGRRGLFGSFEETIGVQGPQAAG
jgi:hypothetical protein